MRQHKVLKLFLVALAFIVVLFTVGIFSFNPSAPEAIPQKEKIVALDSSLNPLQSPTSTAAELMSPVVSLDIHPEEVKWKTYRNEDYGVVFKYPDNLNFLQSFSIWTGGQAIVFAPVDYQTGKDPEGNDFIVNPMLTLSYSCLVPEEVSLASWNNNFQQPLLFGNPFYDKTSILLKTYEIGQRTLFVYSQGCYECYDGWDTATKNNVPHPEKENDGFTAYSCEAGLNKNGNKAAGCLSIITKRERFYSLEMEALKNFFLDTFIPTLELHQGLVNVRDCDGLGESV